jgi:hypothetical protein
LKSIHTNAFITMHHCIAFFQTVQYSANL